MKPNAINYLSLARKAGRIEVGEEPVGAAARAGHARLVLVASDAPDNTHRRARNFVAGTDQQMVVLPFTKEEMGIALGRSVVALAAMTDPAMALAFLNALEDPQKYGQAVGQLTLKADRMRQHQREQKAHERNVRTGKTHKDRQAPPSREEETPADPEKEPRKAGKDHRIPVGRAHKPDSFSKDRPNCGSAMGRGKVFGNGQSINRTGKTGEGRKTWKTGRPDDRDCGKQSGGKPTGRGFGGKKPQDRKNSGRPAGQKYATVSKVARRKPGRKTHGGAEV